MESKRGTGPATSVSPVYPAIKNRNDPADQRAFFAAWKCMAAKMDEKVEDPTRPFLSPEGEDDAYAAQDIDARFRRALMALRHLPRHQRVHAYRTAVDRRDLDLAALREKRERAKQTRHALLRLHRE